MPRRPSRVWSLLAVGLVVSAAVTITRAQSPQTGARGQATPATPIPGGPLAPTKYKNIQVLTDVPADMLEPTMRYFVEATGFQCQSCHVRDQATGEFAYEKDDNRTKLTARRMIKLVQTVNAGDFGARIQCGTCHAGHNQPQGLQLATPLTDDQVAAMAAQAARRGGGPGGGPTTGSAPQQGPPVANVDDVLAKYVDAIGGRDAIEKMTSREITGTFVTRTRQTGTFTIQEKGSQYRETLQPSGDATVVDGATGWTRTAGVNGAAAVTTDLSGFSLWSALRGATLTLPLQIKQRYQLQGARPRPLPGSQTPASILQGTLVLNGAPVGGVTEQFFFDASGLLVRRVLAVRTPMGTLQEQIDYADYRDAGGVKVPFSIASTTPQTLVTMTVTRVTPNAAIADGVFARPGGAAGASRE